MPLIAPVPGIVEVAGKPPSSSKVTKQKLLPLPPLWFISVTVVAAGEVNLKIRSPLNV